MTNNLKALAAEVIERDARVFPHAKQPQAVALANAYLAAEDRIKELESEAERLRKKADLADWAESIIKLNWDPTLTGDDSKLPKEIVDWLLRWKEANRDE